jgi:hypothetical protein
MRAVLFLTAVFVLSIVFWPESKSPIPAPQEAESRRFEAEYLKNLQKNHPQTAALPGHLAD